MIGARRPGSSRAGIVDLARGAEMFWRIMPHANICAASGRLVLLDIRQDRYFLVPTAVERSMLNWLERGYAVRPPEPVLTLLRRSGIARANDPEPTNALKERVTIADALDARPSDDIGVLAAQPWGVAAVVGLTWLKLRLRSLHDILNDHSCRHSSRDATDIEPVLRLAAVFDRSRSLAPIARNCLLDSLALDSWLTGRSLTARLVFGVTLDPFAAHCWLQVRDAILNDSYDHVSRFTPILVV